jgi:prephenate dehydrogenase
MKKLTIIGVGIMGGSLALAVKKNIAGITVCGFARSEKTYRKLKKLSFLDVVECDLKAAVKDADLVAVALPVFAAADCFKKIAGFLKPGAIVFDLSSTKEEIEKSARKYLPKNVSFVGCHPICGSEKTGVEHSVGELYRNALCVITASPKDAATVTIVDFWRSLGMKTVFLNAKAHDKMLAVTSHLPHAVAFALINAVDESYLKFAPPSLCDMTRIANSPASVWSDIFFSNKKNVLSAIRNCMKSLKQFETILAKNNKAAAIKFIEKANARRGCVRSEQA